MNKKQFYTEVRDQFNLICINISNGQKASVQEKSRLEGFMRAGVVLGVTTNPELQQLLEDVHYRVFGESIEERKVRHNKQFPEDMIDYGQYESPAISRKRS